MAIADLLKDVRLKPQAPKPDANLIELTRDFILRRARRLLDLNPGDKDPRKPGDITPAATTFYGNLIARDLPRVHAASEDIGKRVATSAGHLPLDPATIKKRGTKLPVPTRQSLIDNRRRLVRSIVYQACAFDLSLLDQPALTRLHMLCDRRLRTAERMMYDVGQVPARSFNKVQINAHRGGPWPDGWERIFEYPRLPRSLFGDACRRGALSQCSAPMNDWNFPPDFGFLLLRTQVRTNPQTRKSWLNEPGRSYMLLYDKSGGKDAVSAIEGLFQPTTDYATRNLLFCDHTIHALQIEALSFSRTSRGLGHAWLENEMAVQVPKWLCLFGPLAESGRFIAGDGDTSKLFEHVTVRASDLQVGDHVIVYNHPAYANAVPDGVWQLENAVVVQTSPTVLLQGHGSALRDLDGMKTEMLGLFADGLKLRRQDVEGFGRVMTFGSNTVTLDTTTRLHVGMQIDIVSADAAETELATRRTIVSMGGRVVRYDGASVTSIKPHRVRIARTKLFEKYTAIDGSGYKIARRVEPQASKYDAASQKADWFITWVGKEREDEIRKNPARAAFVKEQQFVEFTQEKHQGKTVTVGWFPLWRPSLEKGVPKQRDGKITRIEEVRLHAKNIAGWTFFFDPDPNKVDRVPVVRPREL